MAVSGALPEPVCSACSLKGLCHGEGLFLLNLLKLLVFVRNSINTSLIYEPSRFLRVLWLLVPKVLWQIEF